MDKYNIDYDFIGEMVVGDFTKVECTSHILKNLFKHVKITIEGVGLYGTGKVQFSDKKLCK